MADIQSTESGKKEKKETILHDHQWSIKFLIDQFAKESDRAAVILVASILDETLMTLLKIYLVPIPSSKDSLFDDATSPLSTFSAKIDMAHRVGLISSKFTRDLHIVRKIRNSFAHDIYDCNFNNGSVKSRVTELSHSMHLSEDIKNQKREDDLLDGTRGLFLYLSGAMIFQINILMKKRQAISETTDEWFYSNKPQNDAKENTTKENK